MIFATVNVKYLGITKDVACMQILSIFIKFLKFNIFTYSLMHTQFCILFNEMDNLTRHAHFVTSQFFRLKS